MKRSIGLVKVVNQLTMYVFLTTRPPRRPSLHLRYKKAAFVISNRLIKKILLK